MKRDVFCSICDKNLGRYHDNASTKPLRDHIYYEHNKEYKKIVKIISKIDSLYDDLKKFGIGHWSKIYFHDNVEFEKKMENRPPMTEEQRKNLVAKILKSE